ncbi:hypothetical protein NA57DRAFT_74983 [Rhizodiscina lignyota]|uniref:TPR-like protein n=1 Tax=Rhizodiscina lignyota TaxID=1504668 RepID=A0A9P4IJU3_9PEZI|nr:hypothetical protein NA57DRAFT_74983 [Rhizodiscina lignyota]
MTVFVVLFSFSSGLLLYLPFYYDQYIVKPYIGMPEPVVKELRKAFHYEYVQPDPKQALKYHKRALMMAQEIGMDPFSDMTIGIKIRYAEFFEKFYHYQQAIDVLESIRGDCVKWVQLFGDKHVEDGKRTRILAWAVRCSTKVGELYGLPWIDESEKAEDAFSWAVETLLKEKRRREVEGEKQGEGEWIAGEEFGGTMERLAHEYEEKGQHAYAAPLFLQALTVCPTNTCHAAILMNNLATSLSQQPNQTTTRTQSDPAPTKPVQRPSGGFMKPLNKLNPQPGSSDSSLKRPDRPAEPSLPMVDPVTQAIQWANMAIATAERVPAEDRTEECDQARCAALYNLGELAERSKKNDEAARQYEKARDVAEGVGWDEGVKMANEGIKRTQQVAA